MEKRMEYGCALKQIAQQVQFHESQNRHQERQHHRHQAMLTSTSAINTATTMAAAAIPVRFFLVI